MVKVNLKGVFKTYGKGRPYYYAWRGGPPLRGEPGSPEFIESYREAYAERRTHDDGRIRAIVTLYRAGPFTELADSTKRAWAPWLDEIANHFGRLRAAQFDRAEKIRPVIRRWLNRWSNKPRARDFALQVLSVVLSHAVDLGKIAHNPCDGIKRLYKVDRSEVVWTDADLEQLKRSCTRPVADAVDLAHQTGLRQSDLVRLAWSHVGDHEIVVKTSKSRGKREARIPIHDELRALLDRLPKRATTVLTTGAGRPWADGDSLGSAFRRARQEAGITGLRFHDLRGTAATRFYLAGLEIRVIAEIMGWEERFVEKIIRRYVGRQAATQAVIHQLREAKRRT